MNDMFDPPRPVLLPYSSFFDTLAPLQIREENLGIHLPITDYSSEDEEQLVDYSSEDEEQFFDFTTVNTSLQPPGIIIQPSEQEQNRQQLRKILESAMEEDSRIMSSSKSHDNFNLNSFSSLDNDEENHRERHTLCHCNTNPHRNKRCFTTTGIPLFNLNNPSDLAHIVAQMVSKETSRTATESINRSFHQPDNTNKNLQYINPANLTEIIRIEATPETHLAMNNPNELHPHPPISPADVEQQHPITGLQLIPAAMSLTSNSAVVAEIRQDQNLTDDYFADCTFPEATLTVFQNGILRTVQGRAFCCFHFDRDDPRMFHVAALSMPGAVVRLPTQPPIDSDGNPQGPPGAVHAIPIRVRRVNSSPTSFEGPLPPPPPPTSTPYPAYVLNEDHPTYEEAITFGSVPSIVLSHSDNTHDNDYTELEQAFLHHVARYFEGRGEIEQGIQIPEELEDGAYLEALGPEARISLRFPLVESLFARAARSWPDTPFGIFRSPTPIVPNRPEDPVPVVRLPTASATTNDSIRSSSPEYDWQYPDSPQELPPLELPVTHFRTLTTSMLEIEAVTMETTEDGEITASTPPDHLLSPIYAPHSPSLSFDDAVKLEQQELDELSLLFCSSSEVLEPRRTLPAPEYREDPTSSNSSTDSIPSLQTLSSDSTTSSLGDDISSADLNITLDSITINADGPKNDNDPLNSSLTHSNIPLIYKLQTLESTDPTLLPPRYTLKQRKVAQALSARLYDLMRILEVLRNIRFDTRTSPRLEARWHEPFTKDKNCLFGHPTLASLEADIAQNIGQGLSRPNHWQFHLARVIEVRQIINDIFQISSDLAILFGYSLGIRGFALKEGLDLSYVTHSFHGLLHQFEIDYLSVLLFFLSKFEFTHQHRQLRPLLYTDLPKKIDLWTVIVKIVDQLEPPCTHLALARWKGYTTTDVFWE